MEYRAAPYLWEKRRRLTDEERQCAAEQWAQLVREDALLRAVVNGEVRSVGEDFYDEIIFSLRQQDRKNSGRRHRQRNGKDRG